MSQSVLYYLIIAVIITEYLTGFIKDATILSRIREFFKALPVVGNFFTELLECGYCLSVWVTIFVTLAAIVYSLLPTITGIFLLDVIIVGIITVSFSNSWHGFRDRYLDTRKDNRYKEL